MDGRLHLTSRFLCICGILFPINSYNINLLEAKGRSDLHLRLEIIRRIIGVAAAFIGLQFGIYGLLWSTANHAGDLPLHQ